MCGIVSRFDMPIIGGKVSFLWASNPVVQLVLNALR